ncbi:hypothetical protein ARMSODRAFT_624330 [Armillaria solidipes]|uniref:Uncharacterized protein n=1 Tax=Armillaria solidipes TaxID=1076256 RepID=A0A2H3B6U3_9AGAR|nr:hypothetical protein ARMSODRAFT_624330 [Armillaria solidipes]
MTFWPIDPPRQCIQPRHHIVSISISARSPRTIARYHFCTFTGSSFTGMPSSMPAIGGSVGGYVALGCQNTKAIRAVFESLVCGQFKALDICGMLIFDGRSPFYVNSRICGMSRRLERGCRGFASRSDNVSEVPSCC